MIRRAASWALVLASAVTVERLTWDSAPLFRMTSICAALLVAFKVLVLLEEPAIPPLRRLAFATLWPGMRPAAFAVFEPRDGSPRLLFFGALWLACGSLLLVLAARADSPILALPALSLMLHFGVFHLLAGAWRGAGADTDRLFRAPVLATSLAEFWGRRWNLAFSELARIAVARPVARAAGARAGMAAAFAFSGLLHELAISVPVGAGYGGPLLYFAVQAAGMWIGVKGRVLTLAWIVLPAPALFHGPFLEGVVRPIIRSIAA